MHWRIKELQHFGDAIAWLSAAQASAAYSLAREYDSSGRLGLNEATVSHIERIEFGDHALNAKAWLCPRLPPTEELIVVFGEEACFKCTSKFFATNWEGIFVPSRDDAIVYSEGSRFILFYCHENEFEVGEREP